MLSTMPTILERKGLQAKIIDPKLVRDSDLIISSVDAGGGMTPDLEKQFVEKYKMEIPLKWKKWPLEKWSPVAIQNLKEYLHKEPVAYLCLELGPRYVEVLHHAAVAGKPLLDADTIGRAVPEITMSKLSLNNANLMGTVLTSHFGDVAILKRVMSIQRLEDIVRSFAIASGGGAGMAVAMNGREMKKVLVKGSLSRCLNLGRELRKVPKDDPAGLQKLIHLKMGGRLLFRGQITGIKRRPKQGHLYGEYLLRGTKEFSGHVFRMWFKNENHMSWMDEKPNATSPDILTLYDPEAGRGLWNWEKIPKDHDLYVFGIPCDNFWRTKRGIGLLGPQAFGFKEEYVPVELLPKSGI